MIKRKNKEEEEVEEETEEETEVKIEEKPKNFKKEKTIVVTELPKQEVRKAPLEDGTLVNLLSIEEAFTEILEKIREIHKGVVG